MIAFRSMPMPNSREKKEEFVFFSCVRLRRRRQTRRGRKKGKSDEPSSTLVFLEQRQKKMNDGTGADFGSQKKRFQF